MMRVSGCRGEAGRKSGRVKLGVLALFGWMVVAGGPVKAEETSARAVADRYIAAYTSTDFEALEELYAEDVVFTDPTSKSQPGGGYEFRGREATVRGLRAVFDNAQSRLVEARYLTPNGVYEGSGHVIYAGEIEMLWERKADGRRFKMRGGVVTIVQVRDGRVVEHRDYANYDSMRVVDPG